MQNRRLFCTVCLVALLAMGMFGCVTTDDGMDGRLSFPVWVTSPTSDEQRDTLVDMGMKLPKHLRELAARHGLPGWVVYGVVRCLGAQNLYARGTVKSFTVRDAIGESRVVVDDVRYNVPAGQIGPVLREISGQVAAAENDLEVRRVLGNHVRYRFGGYVLFSLRAAGGIPHRDLLGDNPMIGTGEWKGGMETFDATGPAKPLQELGWRETASEYIVTQAGQFVYGDPVGAFRKTEEDAIYELAKSVLFKLSHLEKTAESLFGRTDRIGDVIAEETLKEEVSIGIKGLRVTHRVVDLASGMCLVVVRVPKSGVYTK